MKYVANIQIGFETKQDLELRIAEAKRALEQEKGTSLREVMRQRVDHGAGNILKVFFEPVGIVPHVPQPEPRAITAPDPLQAKRDRQAFLDRQFTPDQQRAIGMILERWWSQKMAGIETKRVAEAVEGHPRRIAQLEAEVAELKARFGPACNLKDGA